MGLGAGDRVTGAAFAGRSRVMAPVGMAATSQPLATEAAVAVLRRGGHAVDAALAANAVLALVEPMSCGLGGDLFALVWCRQERRLVGLNASGRSAGSASLAAMKDRCGESLPMVGPLTVTVPGAVDGWWQLHQRFGRLPWADLFESAIRYGVHGFPLTDLTAFHWREYSRGVMEQPGFRAQWMPTGRAPVAGARCFNPDLSKTLERLALQGRDDFYGGEPAALMSRAVGEHGGLLTDEDFASHTSAWVEPLSTSYRGMDVWQLPPNTQGAAVLQMLNLLEGFELGAMGFGSPDHLHHVLEAKKLVFEDRARHYADPDFQTASPDLISKTYAAERRRLIKHRAGQYTAGDPRLQRGDTVCIVTADAQRNMVCMMQSVFLPFGSGVTPDGLGFVLQNRGALFALDPEHANAFAPSKRPFHTLIPSFVTRNGEPFLCFGVMGGSAQPQIETQVLLNLLDFGMNLQEAGDAPRVLHEGSSTPTGIPSRGVGTATLESGFPPQTVRDLSLRGHHIGHTVGLYGGYQAIAYDAEHDMYHGASECRQDGHAAGY